MILARNTRQQELLKQSLQYKEIANLAIDRNIKDKDVLKTMGGPFTLADAVGEYVAATNIDDGT